MHDRGTSPAGLVRQAPDHRVTRNALAPAASTPPVLTSDTARQYCMVCLNVLIRHLQPQVIQVRERAQIRAIKDSIGHVEVFQMDGVGTPIIGRPRPLPGHDTPNPANNTYTLNYEEPAIFCAPHTRRLTPRQQERLREAFVADEAHISIEVAYRCAQQVRDVFHQDTPAHGRRLAAHLIESLPACPIPEIARLGADPTQVEGRLLGLLRHSRSQQRANRSHQRNHRTRQTHRQRLPQPHQLPTPNAPHRRRPRRLHPHSTMKSP